MSQVTVVADTNVQGRIVLNGVRLAFAHLNSPQQPRDPGGKPSFGAALLIPNTEAAAIEQVRAVMWQLAQATFGAQAAGVWQELMAGNKTALRDGALKASTDGFAGHHFVSANAAEDRPPVLFDIYLDPATGRPRALTRPQNRIYSGCYANVQIKLWAQNNKYGKRINAELLAVQFAADGPAFGGAATPPDLSMFGGVQEPVGQLPTDTAPPAAAGFAPPAAAGFAPPAAAGFAPPAAAGFAPPAAAGSSNPF